MTIQVQCPNGCTFAVPASRKGKMVLCGTCNASVRIPRNAENVNGQVVFRALLIADSDDLPAASATAQSDDRPRETNSPSASDEPSKMIGTPQRTRSTRQTTESARSNASNPFDFLAKEKIADRGKLRDNGFTDQLDSVDVGDDDLSEVVIQLDREPAYNLVQDRQWLTRFYGICLLVIGLINAVPVIALWIAYSQQLSESAWPRWAFLAILVTMIFVVYSAYLMQLADWTSLMVVTVFSLFIACAYGFAAGSLWLGNATGPIATLLQLPQSYYQFGPIWCGIMFCLMALASFTFGRDVIAWHRSEGLRLINT